MTRERGWPMETFVQKSVDIHQLRKLISDASDIDEIKALKSYIPELSCDEQMIAHRNLDDGINDEKGTLIGEKHPND